MDGCWHWTLVAYDQGRVGKWTRLGGTVEAMTPRLPLLALGLAAVVAGCGSTASGSTSSGSTSSSGGSGAYGAPAATATATAAASTSSTGRGTTLHLTADPGGALRFNTSAPDRQGGQGHARSSKNPSSSGHAARHRRSRATARAAVVGAGQDHVDADHDAQARAPTRSSAPFPATPRRA